MVTTSGGAAHHLVTPSLYSRAAQNFLPSTSVAVRKATRAFDEYVHEAAALCAHLGYELPKKAVKAGVTIVEVIMSEKQVALFFPDPAYRMLQRGRASIYDKVRPFLVFLFAMLCAKMYFDAFYVPPVITIEPVSWYDMFRECIPSLSTVWSCITGAVSFSATITSECLDYVWPTSPVYASIWVWFGMYILRHSVTQCFTCATFYHVCHMICPRDYLAELVGFPVNVYMAVTKHFKGLVRVTQGYACKPRPFGTLTLRRVAPEWFCPAPPQVVVSKPWRLAAFLWYQAVDAYWAVVPLLRLPEFWHAMGVFFVVLVLLNLLTRRRTVWKVQLRIESQAFSIARGQKTRAMQETTTEKVAATPIITHVENQVKTAHPNMPIELRDKYLAICLLVTSGWADNRVTVVQTTPGEPDSEPTQDNKRECLGELGVAKRLLRTRNNTCPPNVWRRSVRVIRKSWNKLFDDVQRGQDRILPGADDYKEHYSGVVTGPEFFDITEGFEGNVDDEIAGVSRHLRQLKSTITGEYLDRTLAPSAEARLDMATDIICGIVAVVANKYFLSILEWSLPQKWGAARETYFQRLVEVGFTLVRPILCGFVKLSELALPLTKLPRLVGTMGMLNCAKDAAVLGSVEQLFKKFFPHLLIKGMTQDGVNSRFASFAKRAAYLGLKILSIDMSAFDSSWLPGDRKRVRRVMATIVDTVQALLDAELQEDYPSQCGKKRVALRWLLNYVEVQLAYEDSILFSGERGTSIGNRILMLIVWSAELLRVYGVEDGTDRIEKMFYCPPEAHKTSTDERPHGQVEQHEAIDYFPADHRYDNNMGDGDDCSLVIPHNMYASRRDFILAYEVYHKVVEPCSAWSEGNDMECLSTMTIKVSAAPQRFEGGCRTVCPDRTFFVPKVQRNITRLIAHKIRVPPGKHFAEGCQTYIPTTRDYTEIATDLWQRSYTLVGSMCSRHLNRAMFEYCYAKTGDTGTVYDEDKHRLGKVDGDLRLSECLEQVRVNATRDVSAYAMVKATHFDTFESLSKSQVRALQKEWYDSDHAWSVMELTDDLCAHPDVLLTAHTIGPNVATALGFKQEFIEQIKRQLVKGESNSPDMTAGTRPGGHEESVSDGATKPSVQAVSVIVHKDNMVLCGFEPQGKPRAGMLTLPSGKEEKGETSPEAAVRELEEEGAVYVQPSDFVLVRKHTCGIIQCTQYRVPHCKTQPSSVQTADRLTELKFRTAADILENNAPKLIANCLKEIIDRDGKVFVAAALGGVTQPASSTRETSPSSRGPVLQPTTSFPANSPGHVTMHTGNGAPGSSAPQDGHPAAEVEPAAAEADGTGPSQREDYIHAHVCPLCGVEYIHAHKYDARFKHKIRKGACPNVACAHHSRDCGTAVDALTSRDPEETRRPPVSSPVNGYGTSHLRKNVGKRTAGNTSGTDLSHPPTVSQKARASPKHAESNGRGTGQQSKGKLPKVSRPTAKPETAAPVAPASTTPHTQPSGVSSQSSTGPSIVDEMSRASESRRDAVRGGTTGCATTAGMFNTGPNPFRIGIGLTSAEPAVAERAGNSGHSFPKGDDAGV